jgi:hypothetical protein
LRIWRILIPAAQSSSRFSFRVECLKLLLKPCNRLWTITIYRIFRPSCSCHQLHISDHTTPV